MSYRLPDDIPEQSEPDAIMLDVARHSHITVDNGTVSRISIPCFYARRFTRRDKMIWDHMTWPSPGRPDRSDYAQVFAINVVDLESEGYTDAIVVLGSNIEGLSMTAELDYNFIQLNIVAMCQGARTRDMDVEFSIYVTGSNSEVGQLRDLVTKGTLHIISGYI